MRKHFDDILAILFLLAVSTLIMSPYLRGQEIPLDLGHARTLAPWLDNASPSSHPLSVRHVQETYPAYLHLAEIRQHGDGLLWNPLDGLGAPFLAQWHTRALSPFSIPVYVFGLIPGLALSGLLKLFIAGLTAFYVARRFGLRAPIAGSVAGLYLLSAPLLSGGAEPLSDAMPWMPLVLLAGERLALRQRHAWTTLALATTLIAMAGHPPAILGVFLFLLCYIVLRPRGQAPGRRLLHLIPMTLGIAVGLAAAAVQLFPYMEYLGQTAENATAFQPAIGLDWKGILLPRANLTSGIQSFPGFLPFLLLPLWWVVRPFMDSALRSRTDALLLIGLGGSLLSVAFGDLIVAPWLDSSVFLLGSGLALAFVAGAVAEEWLVLTADQVRDSLPTLTKIVPVAWIIWLGSVIAVGVLDSVWLLIGAALLITLLTFALFAFTLFRPTARGLGYGLVLIGMLSAAMLTLPYKPRTAVDQILPPSAFGKALSEGQLSRIAGSGALKAWPLSFFGIQQCFAPNTSGLARMEAFEAAAEEQPLLLRRTGSAGLLLTKEDIQGAMSDIRPVLFTKAVFEQGAILFEDAAMTARARVIYAGKRAEQAGQLPENADSLPILEGVSLPENGNPEAGAATVDSETPSELRISVPNTPPGILVLADMWYPGWTATVDAADTLVFPVDGIFRGIEIGEGAHEAVFRFQPASFRYGLIISAVGLLVIVFGLWRNLAAHD